MPTFSEPFTASGWRLVPCGEPHDAELFALISYPATTAAKYPGKFAVELYSDRACLHAFWDYFGGYEKDSDYLPIVTEPDAGSWEHGDRTTGCMVVAKTGHRLTGASKGRGATPLRPDVHEKGLVRPRAG